MTHRYQPPAQTSLQPLFEDDYLLAFCKPTGLLSVPGRGPDKSDCMSTRVQYIFPGSRIVHRLDMETSGLMLFARNIESQRLVSKLFEAREIKKTYVALVTGRPKPENGIIDAPLIADWPNRPRQKIDLLHGKPSQTRYRLLRYLESRNVSRLELNPVTGRSHQLRVHLHFLGHPILGDNLYSLPGSPGNSDRLMLHATRLELTHPFTRKPLVLTSPEPF